ncbi:MAG: hypothetical protein LBJ00_14895 [Planctomycetaceae bacterium]|nr:hypothetical protein [Planctomycetaceae bacterium]
MVVQGAKPTAHWGNFCLIVILLCSSCFEIPEAEHASAASRSGSSRAKPVAHTGFGTQNYNC